MFNYNPPKVLTELSSETLPSGKRFYTLPDGQKVPSITTILSYFKKDIIQEWRKRVGEEQANKVSKRASSRGTNVHKLCEDYLNNVPNFSRSAFPDALEMFNSIKPILNNINNIHYQECPLYSLQLGVAGRVDCIGEYNGVLSVIDFKTSSKIKTVDMIEDYFKQEAFYALAYEELIGQPINQLVTIMAVENEKPLVFIERTDQWIEPLVKTVTEYKRLHK
jgi:genome maintenance exonuclease 1